MMATRRRALASVRRFHFVGHQFSFFHCGERRFSYINTQLPLLYVHLIVMMTKLTMLLWAVISGVTMCQACHAQYRDNYSDCSFLQCRVVAMSSWGPLAAPICV